MARNDDDDKPWPRQLLVGLGALLVVALLIGGVVSVVALGAARVAGIDDAGPTATVKPSLFIRSGNPTTKVEPYPQPSGVPSRTVAPSARPATKPPRKPAMKRRALSLEASPREVGANERITLTGEFPGHDGARLQVQRFEGGSWGDFPVQTTVGSGRFSTYITTGHTGVNRLRVIDPASGRSSDSVRVTVR
jgi:hypothetical protein